MLLQKDDFQLERYSPAKLNLFLEIVKRRNDGYHELETLMVPINLYDTILMQSQARGQISVRGWWSRRFDLTNARYKQIPQSNDNLVVQALELLKKESGSSDGAHVELIKRIPMEAGLGGGPVMRLQP